MADDARLVDGLRANSREAFREAVAQYSGPMLATARAIAGAAHAEDIVQDAWLTVFQKIDGFEGRAGLATWLQRIVTNRALSHLRKSRREVAATDLPGNDPGGAAGGERGGGPGHDWFDDQGNWASPPPRWDAGSPEALLMADELQGCLDKHMLLMPESQRAVVVMREMQALSFDEICTTLALSAANARVLLHRGRVRLVDMINRFRDSGQC